MISMLLSYFSKSERQKRRRIRKAYKALTPLPVSLCDTDHLAPSSDITLSDAFAAEEASKGWAKFDDKMAEASIPDGTGGVNPGDRRAIYHLIRYLKPCSVLEVGTHIGASTTTIAQAIHDNEAQIDTQAKMTTVDIANVNCEQQQPWTKYKSPLSPKQHLERLNLSDLVTFKTSDSLELLRDNENRFDFIFLDGSHTADQVYKEVPFALKALKPGGVILLHDFYPGLQPIWETDTVIAGPYVAIERFLKEGANFQVLPLATLPWPTKQGSCVTSLALLTKRG